MRPEATPDDLTRWQSATPHELVAHILEAYHKPERQLLAKLTDLHLKALAAWGSAFPVLAHIAPHLSALATDLCAHFVKEERTLFPDLLRRHADAEATMPLGIEDPGRMAMEEHASVSELVDNLRHLTRDYTPPEEAPEDVCALYAGLAELDDHLHRHLYLETHLLFRRRPA